MLGVRCLNCDHRAVLDSQEVTIIRKANMTPLRILKLRCQKCGVIGAGKNFWEMCTPLDGAEVDQFLMGHDIGRKVGL